MKNSDKLDKETIQIKWRYLQAKLADQFGADADVVNALYLIGVQESGKGFTNFTRDEKIALITMGNHKVLTYFGYYKEAVTKINDLPKFEQVNDIKTLSQLQKDELILHGIILYFMDINYI